MYPKRSGWWWVPSLYFAQGIPYVVVTMVTVTLYKRFGVSNSQIGWYTSLLGLPWVIKPLWGPLVDLYWTKRNWVLSTQFLMAVGLLLVSLVLPTPLWWKASLTVFALMAFASATHDIAADGFYMLGLDPHRQALFNGLRSTFWRLSMIIGTGVLVIIAGVLESHSGPKPVVFSVAAVPKDWKGEVPQVPAPRGGDFAVLKLPSEPVVAGTTSAVTLRLARPAESNTTVAANVSWEYTKWYSFFFPVGPEFSVRAEEADRIEFGPDSWDKEKSFVLKVDKNLKQPVVAHFRVSAGNIPWAWAICLGVVGGVYLLLALYHSLALPKSALDVRKTAERPFYRAAFWLFLAVGIPALLLVAPLLVKQMLGSQLPEWVPAAIRDLFPKKLGDAHKDLIAFLCLVGLALVVGIGFGLIAPLRRVFGAFFSACARNSGMPFDQVFVSFFQKKGILRMLAFLLFYRFADAMLVKMITPFMLDPAEKGGLGLSTTQIGFAYGTIGVFGLLLGGIVGSVYAATYGLQKVRLVMCLFMNVPIALFVLLSYYQPAFHIVLGSVFIEQFGYGFGFSFYMLYMLYMAGQGEHKTSHYALCTGFMALSYMIPGMISGIIQELLGHYFEFFLVVLVLSISSFVVAYIIPVDPEFGRKKKTA
ncbi:MAG: hypothetical protein N2644_04865 [Candidatus Sumerlaea chitinivorans]|uniref:AmpG permease n=1 Tax=Sumerlaea chitinivorans TaxID=2250252 RepID=A0A2Z4Y6L8_SUMC1|nr:AmpG permease [Candidatus Sumerlaea chitinivorans]MCX7963799.1 hypothetical protein [Candidatus Sumerlaea chitinivorans]